MTQLPQFPQEATYFKGQTLRIEALAHGVMRLTLDRPGVRNAFNALVNCRYALVLWRACGWQPWTTMQGY